MLDELLYILNFDNKYPEVANIINSLKESNLNSDQENLIYDLAALAFQVGEDQGKAE